MSVNFNTHLSENLPEALTQTQRALLYGDTLFETLRVFDGQIPLLDRHWARLSAGLSALGFDVPEAWGVPFFQKEISKICPPNARVRLSVWRSPGGFYLPQDDMPQFLITAQPLASNSFEWQEPGITLGVSDDVRLPIDTFSSFKTLNAVRYVVAALEAKKRAWDDALILNSHDRICEATSSNVFWWEKDLLCTVPLSEGCVAGVQRALLLAAAAAAGFVIQEKPVTFAALQSADEIFLTNAIRGLLPVYLFAGRPLKNFKSKTLFEEVFLKAYDSLL